MLFQVSNKSHKITGVPFKLKKFEGPPGVLDIDRNLISREANIESLKNPNNPSENGKHFHCLIIFSIFEINA